MSKEGNHFPSMTTSLRPLGLLVKIRPVFYREPKPGESISKWMSIPSGSIPETPNSHRYRFWLPAGGRLGLPRSLRQRFIRVLSPYPMS